MQISLTLSERDALFVHLSFIVLCTVVLLLPVPLLIGPRLFMLVVAYNILIPVVGYWRNHPDWLSLWLLVFSLSLFMVFPDWFLADPLGILVFLPDGFPKIGPVSGYMAGLWAIPLFIIVFLGLRIGERYTTRYAYTLVAAVSFLLFTGAEAGLTFVWHAQNIFMIGSVALYIIGPELILGLSTYWAYASLKEKPRWWNLFAAFFLMVLYLGSACFFHLLINKIIFSV
jgi:hypothetical protein